MTAGECNCAVDRQQRHGIRGTGEIYQLYAQRTRCLKFSVEAVFRKFPVVGEVEKFDRVSDPGCYGWLRPTATRLIEGWSGPKMCESSCKAAI